MLVGGLVLLAFLLLAGIALERAFRDTALTTSRERLQATIYMLMGAADVEPDGSVQMPAVLPAPELVVPDSGILAAVTNAQGSVLWRSESSLVATLIYPQANTPGEPVFGTATTSSGEGLYTLSYPLIWELDDGTDITLIFHAAEDTRWVAEAVAAFRDTLQLWLGGAALCLLVLQAGLLIWLLRPFETVATEIGAVEAGQQEQLSGSYPRELQPLTKNLNALLRTHAAQTNRYRNALADLAHSLKTPLAVMRNSQPDAANGAARDEFLAQLDRMDDTIAYQLQRAALSGKSPLSGPVDVMTTAQRVVNSLRKVYHDKNIDIRLNIEPRTVFIGDAGDLAELLGNLGDNACKWCRHKVTISATNEPRENGSDKLQLTVEDDGPGIPEALATTITERGFRADATQPGQGIGLAIARDIVVEAYSGELKVAESSLGGAQIDIRI